MPAENTRSNDVMQKCDIDWPICNHEPARWWEEAEIIINA